MKDSCFPLTEVWLKSKDAEILMGNKMALSRFRKKNPNIARPAAAGRGGGFEYLLNALPAAAREKYVKEFNREQKTESNEVVPVYDAEEIETYDNEEDSVTLYDQPTENKPVIVNEKEKEINLIKNRIVDLYLQYQDKSNLKKIEAQFEFIKLYNLGAHPELQQIISSISRGSVERWKKTREEQKDNPFALAPKYNKQQRTEIPFEQAQWLANQYFHPNRRQLTEIAEDAVKIFTERGDERVFHQYTYIRLLKKMNRYNHDLVSYYREGGDKALNDNDLPFVSRDKSRVEVGSIIIADGHKLDFLVNDPVTGKPKRMMLVLFIDYYSNVPLGYEIASTENVKAISIALFRSIMFLGKYPQIVYLDNGRAFASKLFKGKEKQIEIEIGLYKRLGMNVITAWPYHGQSKTIEPFFRVVAKLARRMPTYIGNRIELQPAYMHRGEKLHQRVHDKVLEHINIDIFTAYRAVEWQFNEYMNTPQKGGSHKGKKPIDIFSAGKGEGVDKIKLMALMMVRDNVTIKRCQFSIKDKDYQSEELYGLNGRFEVRYDFIYNDIVYVIDEHFPQGYIAVPIKPQVHPAAFHLGTEEDQKLLAERLEMRNRLRKSTTTDARLFLLNEIWSGTQKQLEDQKILQLNEEAKKDSTPEEQKKALKLKTGTDDVDLSFMKTTKKDEEGDRSWV